LKQLGGGHKKQCELTSLQRKSKGIQTARRYHKPHKPKKLRKRDTSLFSFFQKWERPHSVESRATGRGSEVVILIGCFGIHLNEDLEFLHNDM
jgi:hypothetical protein